MASLTGGDTALTAATDGTLQTTRVVAVQHRRALVSAEMLLLELSTGGKTREMHSLTFDNDGLLAAFRGYTESVSF